MKVLLDLYYLNAATTGIKTYMLELASAARKYTHPEVEWIFTHDPSTQATLPNKGKLSKLQRLQFHLDYFKWKEFQLPDLVKKYQPDVLICPDFVSPAASLPCKRFTVFHDAFFWQVPENYPRWWRKYFLGLIKKGLKEQTSLVTTTEYSKRCLEEFLGKNWPMKVIYQTYKGLHGAADIHFLSKNHLQKQGYFLHIGTFDRRKNLPFLVEAYAKYLSQSKEKKKLVLAGGEGQSRQMNDFPLVKQLIDSFGIQDQVLLPGYLEEGEIKALYQGAFGYIFPSLNEGFGIPLLESMAFGVPVIHSNQAALMEVAGLAGLCFPLGDLHELSEKMILLEQENDLRTRLSQLGKARVKEFSAENFIDSFHKLILSA